MPVKNKSENPPVTGVSLSLGNISSVEWFCLGFGLFLTLSYFIIKDDAFVYFRYIDNFLFLKIGLVYNKGQFVEGFTSPLWLLLLMGLRSLRFNFYYMLLAISSASFLVFWFLLLKINRKLSPPTKTVNFPLIYLTLNYGVLSYFSSGLETPLVLIMALVYALYILDQQSIILRILLSVSPLIRPELILSLFVCLIWTKVYYKNKISLLVIFTALFVGSYQIFRIYYYADLFPNTFYLKDSYAFEQGILYLKDTIVSYRFDLFFCFFICLIIWLRLKTARKVHIDKRLMMLTAALPVVLYVMKIGGDYNHFRFLCFPFCLTTCAFAGLLEHSFSVFDENSYKYGWLKTTNELAVRAARSIYRSVQYIPNLFLWFFYALISKNSHFKVITEKCYKKYFFFPLYVTLYPFLLTTSRLAVKIPQNIRLHIQDAFSSLLTNNYKNFLKPTREIFIGLFLCMIIFFYYYPTDLLSFHPFSPFLFKANDQVNPGIADIMGLRGKRDLLYAYWGPKTNIERFSKLKEKKRTLPEDIMSHGYCSFNYINIDKFVVHSFGLTDAFLARTAVETNVAGHKFLLMPLARDLVRLYSLAGSTGKGVFRNIAGMCVPPAWITENIDVLEIIEKKVYNRHRFLENLRLAFTFPKIIPVSP